MKTIALAILSMVVVGCGGYTAQLPPRLTLAEEAAYESIQCRYRFAVEPYEYPAYSDHLLQVLKKTKCGRQFFIGDDGSADFTIQISETTHGSAIIPLAWMLSLGLIPVWVEENFGYGLIVKRGGKDIGQVDYRGRSKGGLGWIPTFYNLHPDWAMTNPEKHARYFKRLLIKIDDAVKEAEATSAPTTGDPAVL